MLFRAIGLFLLIVSLTSCVINSQKPATSPTPTAAPTTPTAPIGSLPSTCGLTYTAQLVDPSGRQEFSKRAFIVLEAGSAVPGTNVTRYRTNSSMIPPDSGAITWCVPGSAPTNWILVITIGDGNGSLYPPTVIPHPQSGATIIVGGSSSQPGNLALPTTLTGVVTSAPIATAWHAYPLVAVTDPANPSSTMEIVMPAMNGTVAGVKSVDFGGAMGFTVSSNSCPAGVFCQQYSVEVPSQPAFVKTSNGYEQGSSALIYGVGLVSQDSQGHVNCTPSEGDTWEQIDGSNMTSGPGVTLHVATLSLSSCH